MCFVRAAVSCSMCRGWAVMAFRVALWVTDFVILSAGILVEWEFFGVVFIVLESACFH